MRFPFAVLCAALLFVLVLVGCGGGGGGGNDGGGGYSLVGSWYRSAMRIGGQTVGCPGSIDHDGITTSCYDDGVDFYSDGSFYGTAGSGTWRLSGSNLTVTSDGQSEILPIRFTNGGNEFETSVSVSYPVHFTEVAVFTRINSSKAGHRLKLSAQPERTEGRSILMR